MLQRETIGVNGLSLDFRARAERLLGADHSDICVNFPEEQCVVCRLLFGDMSIEERIVYLRQQERKKFLGLAGTPPPHFLRLLATAMAEEPELFAPIVQYLNSHGRSPA